MVYELEEKLSKSMKALRINKTPADQYELATIPIPKAEGTKVLIKIGSAGLCHTDLVVLNGGFGGGLPLTGSHEPAGTIVELCDRALEINGGLKIGDRVVALFHQDLCGTCSDCKFGDWKYCSHSKYGGITTDGYFAEYALVEAKSCVIIPDSMSFEQAAPLTCAGVTAYTAIKKANLKPGQIIAISGLGAVGSLGVQMAKEIGLKVVAIDVRPEPIELVNSFELKPDLIINRYEGWEGVDVTLLVADPPASHSYGAAITRKHGTLILVSGPLQGIKLEFTDLLFKDLCLKGSLHGNAVDLKETIDLCSKSNTKSHIKKFHIEEHKKMLRETEKKESKGKIVVTF
ncbi:uncharacterized protein L201_006195 [Kwoniella dendrophila CBS 6074]|uniref:Enoyl reductase (ER) domain-containing protein n=1 Tax=Kwoniella dendrophila CBS 6074 TaxID=1295534 RepID=A0AAX4K134_9TREE